MFKFFMIVCSKFDTLRWTPPEVIVWFKLLLSQLADCFVDIVYIDGFLCPNISGSNL